MNFLNSFPPIALCGRLLLGIGLMLFLRFLLVPTAWIFYELYHLSGWDLVYWGYSLFKVGGYYFNHWPYQTRICIALGLTVAVPWRWLLWSLRSNVTTKAPEQ
ncbi:hypothetical protein [Parahaliea aestuarii]|uniref:Uncharacterized protein n=1 Tax=Parahaliea aestuarii TaxID=1852021 RepID=A0A5C9A007_9GAMM|nr:hypothetical protein [Parahaliea aestuarii]TXS93110.1 hypothetical protein FVW59_04415 [Parahaliea aestuarii]